MSTRSTRTYGRARAVVGGVGTAGLLMATAGCGYLSAPDSVLVSRVEERILADAVLILDVQLEIQYSGLDQAAMLNVFVGDATAEDVVTEVDQAVDTAWDVLDHEVLELNVILHSGREEVGVRAIPVPDMDMTPIADGLGVNTPDRPYYEGYPVRLVDSYLDARYDD